MKISRYLARTAAAFLVGALSACGGGGDGGGSAGGAPPSGNLQYSGDSNPAVITASNASRLSAIVIADTGDDIVASSLSGARALQAAQDRVQIGPYLARTVRKTVTPRAATSRVSSAPVDQTEACSGGGTVRFFGDVAPLGTGTLTVVYANCVEDGVATTGQATMSIEGADPFNGIYTFYTLTFERLSLRGSSNIDMAGSLTVITTLITNTERSTENIVALWVNSGRMTKSENLVFVDVYDNLRNPTAFSETISGRQYHSVHGYVDIGTVTPLAYSTMTQAWPGSGEVLITGAANARIRATAASSSLVVLALDVNGDRIFETQARVNWNDLIRPAGSDLADTDGDGMHNSWEQAYGLNPNLNDAMTDLDGDGFANIAEYQAGTPPNLHDAVLPPVAVAGRAIALARASDLAYDSVTQRIYAAVRSNPGSVVPIDPLTGALGSPIAVGSLPAKLALSDNGQFLYVGHDGEATVRRINMATQMVDTTIALGADSFFGPYYVDDMEVLPGAAQSIAISRRYEGVSPRHAGVAVFDNTTQRTTVTPGHTGSNVIEFSATADTLYGFNNETSESGFRRMAVTSGGVTVTDVYDSFQPGGQLIYGIDMKFGGGFLFTSGGQMIDPVARVQLPHPTGAPGPTFLPVSVFGLPAPDAALGRVVYLLTDHTWRIWTFDMNTRLQTGSAKLNGVSGIAGSLIRWGANGLAFRTSEGQIGSEGQVVILELPAS